MAAVGKFVFVNYTGEPDVEAKQSLPTAASQPRPKRSSVKRASRARKDNPQLHRQSSSSSTELVFLQEYPEGSSISSGRTPSLDDTDSSPLGFTDTLGYTDSSSPLFSVTQSNPSPGVFDEPSPQSTALVQINAQASPAFFQSDQSALLQAPNPFLRSPAVHRWDPFNTLPLNGLAVDQLATWHFHRPINRNNIWESKVLWLDKVDSHFRRGLWSIALTSTPLFHVLLCIAEMKRSVLTGDRNQISYFEHKIAAMRAVSQGVSRLSSLPQFTGTNGMALPNTFVMLVAIQVNLALGDKEYDAAKTHMRCVTDLVNKAGGLQSFGYTQWRHTIWNDLKLASALLERPMLEYGLRLESAHATFPPEVNSEAHRLSLETVRMIPTSETLTSEMAYDLFNRQHQLCLSFDTTLTEEAHFLAVENAFYSIVYNLCNSIADSQTHTECSDTDMLILGAQLSTWMCMPSLVNMRALFNTVINTIQSKLVYRLWNGLKPDLILQWEATAKLDSLLWILFQASTAAINVCSSGETWMPSYMLDSFLTTTRQVAVRLQIHSLANFERTLRKFPFSENVFGDDCKMLWSHLGLDDGAAIDGMVSPGSMIMEQM
ncbi:unnamed protein product [Aureobasidium pullulans]|nr:unnamed protein product [Aureobasidium pullulans]